MARTWVSPESQSSTTSHGRMSSQPGDSVRQIGKYGRDCATRTALGPNCMQAARLISAVTRLRSTSGAETNDATFDLGEDLACEPKSAHELKTSTYEGIFDWLKTYRPNPSGDLDLKNNKPVVLGVGDG